MLLKILVPAVLVVLASAEYSPVETAKLWNELSKDPDALFLFYVNQSCGALHFNCPKEEFGIYPESGEWEWNKAAVLGSGAYEMVKSGLYKSPKSLYYFLKESFCCREKECLALCGYSPKPYETKYIRDHNVYNTVRKILSMDLPGIERFRTANFIKLFEYWQRTGQMYEDVEAFFQLYKDHREEIQKHLSETNTELY